MWEAAAVWAMPDEALLAQLDELTVEAARLFAAQARTVREIDARGLPAAQGTTGILVWLKERYRLGHREARRLVELGRLLDKRPALDKALADGAVNAEQAEAIGEAVQQLAGEPDVPTHVVDAAETALVEHAAVFAPKALQQLGGRILAHVAPDLADRVDATILARQEIRGQAARTFQLTATGDGRVRCTGWLDVEGAAIITAALDPLCTPRRNHTNRLCDDPPAGNPPAAGSAATGSAATGTAGSTPAAGSAVVTAEGDNRTPGQRRDDALIEICRLALNTGELPVNGGDRPQLVVTVNYDVLRNELGTGQLDTGEQLTGNQVRQLACDAMIIPAVLGGHGQILDHGRARRLITGPLRRALVLRDKGCTFPSCDRPARWCDGHHIDHWEHGGTTSINTCALLCRHHHRTIHRRHWTMRMATDGHPEFIPPTWLDPTRTPRRNTYHRRC